MNRPWLMCLASLLLGSLLAACGEQPAQPQAQPAAQAPAATTAPAPTNADKLVLYCGRSVSLVKPILAQFTADTGIKVDLVDGTTTALAARLRTEGDKSPADVFWAQDPGALGQMAKDGVLGPLPKELLAKVDPKFADPAGLWVATSGRARTVAYAPARVAADQLPKSVFELADPKWKGRVGWAPGNSSFQAFVTAMRKLDGEDKALQWLKDMKANEPKSYAKNTAIIEALAAGEVDLGLPNHYYLLQFKKSEGVAYPVEQAFFADGDIGNLVIVAGVGILKTANHRAAAEQFVAYMLGAGAQTYFTQEVFEYPLAAGVASHPLLLAQDKLAQVAPAVKVEDLDDLEGTMKLLKEAGLF